MPMTWESYPVEVDMLSTNSKDRARLRRVTEDMWIGLDGDREVAELHPVCARDRPTTVEADMTMWDGTAARAPFRTVESAKIWVESMWRRSCGGGQP